jgi:hypothetical protein
MLPSAAPLAAIVAALLLAPTAAAKEGGVARLAAPLPSDAAPGDTITVHWSMEVFDSQANGLVPLNAEGVYIRLIGLDVSEVVGRQEAPGRYVAEVIVPQGGIKAAEFGVTGIATFPDGHTERSNMVFQFDSVLLSAAPPPRVAPADEPATQSAADPPPAAVAPLRSDAAGVSPLVVLGLAALVLAGIGVILSIRRPASA